MPRLRSWWFIRSAVSGWPARRPGNSHGEVGLAAVCAFGRPPRCWRSSWAIGGGTGHGVGVERDGHVVAGVANVGGLQSADAGDGLGVEQQQGCGDAVGDRRGVLLEAAVVPAGAGLPAARAVGAGTRPPMITANPGRTAGESDRPSIRSTPAP